MSLLTWLYNVNWDIFFDNSYLIPQSYHQKTTLTWEDKIENEEITPQIY